MIALLFAAFAVVWGTAIFAKVQTAGGFDAPNSQSQQETSPATTAFGRDAGDVVVVYSSKALTTASPSFWYAVTGSLAALPHSRVTSYATYRSTRSRQFVTFGSQGHPS